VGGTSGYLPSRHGHDIEKEGGRRRRRGKRKRISAQNFFSVRKDRSLKGKKKWTRKEAVCRTRINRVLGEEEKKEAEGREGKKKKLEGKLGGGRGNLSNLNGFNKKKKRGRVPEMGRKKRGRGRNDSEISTIFFQDCSRGEKGEKKVRKKKRRGGGVKKAELRASKKKSQSR